MVLKKSNKLIPKMSLIFVLAACNDDNADYTSDSSQSKIIKEEKTDVVISVNQATDAEEETTEAETTEEETTEEKKKENFRNCILNQYFCKNRR